MCEAIHHLFQFLFGVGHSVDRTALWTGAIALITLFGVVFALFQLRSIRKISRADFAKRFIDSFFTPETRSLFTLLMNSALEYEVKIIEEAGEAIDRLPYFPLKKEIMDQIVGLIEDIPTTRKDYSGLEIDDLLLGQLDDLGWYVRNGLIDYRTALQSFRYYLTHTWEHPSIMQYAVDEQNKGYYGNIKYLYARFQKSPPATSERDVP